MSSSSPSAVATSPTKKTEENKFLNLNSVLKIVMDYFKEGLPYVAMIGFFVFILTLFIVASFYKSDTVFLQKYRYIMMIVFPVIILVYLFLRKGNSDFNPTIVMMISTFVVILMIILFTSYIKTPSFSSKNSIVFSSYIISVIIAAIFIIGLAITYKVFKNSVKKMRGWPGFIVNLLFFIPCLVSDLIDYIFFEFKTAPNTVFVLYIIEIILILAYFYVPKLLKYITTKNGLVLQEQPVYLDKPNIISDNSIFMLPSSVTNSLVSTDVSSSNVYNSNFGLSMWIYVNNMGLNTTGGNGSVLFQIASPNDVNGKPCIRYMGNDQWNFIFNDQLIKTNRLSSKIPSYAKIVSGSKNGNFYTDIPKNHVLSETFMFLYDASKKHELYWVDNDNEQITTYGNLLNIENNYKNNPDYKISYSYSYGNTNVFGVTTKNTFSSISLLLDQIQKDYDIYLPIKQKNNELFQKDGSKYKNDNTSFNIFNMYNLVQSITQTVRYNTKAQYIMTIPSQKWNHIVFNYFENNVDLFINGNLERSMELKNNPILQLPTDIISVGDTKGIHGSICNLVYYNSPITKTKISQIYNTYSIKNPPV